MEIKNLSARYLGGKCILHDVSLQIHQGEIVCVVGGSGCGKPTLLNFVLRMPGKIAITDRKILFCDRDILSLSQEEFRFLRGAKIGMVYQEPCASLNPIRKIISQFYDTLNAQKK